MLFFFQSFLFDRQDASPTIIESKILRVVLRFLIPKMINFNLFTFSLLNFTNCLSFMILTISFGAALFANFYRPQTKFAKVMFLHLSVSHSVHRAGVCLSACWDTPRKQKPPGSRHPLSSACWEIRSTSGRYASYWNAILLLRKILLLVLLLGFSKTVFHFICCIRNCL